MRPWLDRLVSSDPAPPLARRNRRRGDPTPAELPAGPLRTGPNDPTATPAPRRSPGGVPHPATSPAVAVARRRYRPLSPGGRPSSPAGRRIRGVRGSVMGWSVGRWWKRGRRGRRATFSLVSVPGQKRYRILPSERPVWRPFRSVTQPWPQWILFGHAGFIILQPAPGSRGNSRASTPRGWPPVPGRAAGVR